MDGDLYQIIILGDNYLECTINLQDSEIEVFNKIINSMKPDGPYAPNIIIRNLSEVKRQRELEEQKAIEEENERVKKFEEECSHLGKYSIAAKYPNLVKLFAQRGM